MTKPTTSLLIGVLVALALYLPQCMWGAPAALIDAPPGTCTVEKPHRSDGLAAATFPQISCGSTKVRVRSANLARIDGNLTLHGATKPVALPTAFNGGCAGTRLHPHARLGFSAHRSLKRSAFGITKGLTPPSSNMGLGDEADVTIETECNGPAWAPPKAEVKG
jgi:YceI-like domain